MNVWSYGVAKMCGDIPLIVLYAFSFSVRARAALFLPAARHR
jgi:hypothetical protein